MHGLQESEHTINMCDIECILVDAHRNEPKSIQICLKNGNYYESYDKMEWLELLTELLEYAKTLRDKNE